MSLLRGSAAFILLMVSQNIAWAQLAVDTNETPSQLVKTILSNSIIAYNIKYTGEHGAIGYFDGTHSNIGLNNGVIMTTGRATNAIGPSNPGNKGVNNGLPGDSALTVISGDSTFDACILEFDFVPYADTMSFDFVFGSQEYPEFTC
ncbi:MAG TPA: choice-of-anchor L domain-containing protein, partial [Bacteroidia bacterium]|nr:choice-of-anchor L domain-containing protein [Bacteroidia bacterium]